VTRIVAGSLGGRRIDAPPGTATRPTSDRVREALFSTLDALTDLDGCHFLDLYAGSGAIGLEAASRGAESVLLIEADARAARTVRANIAALGLGARCRLVTARLPGALATPPPRPYDVVFADPPYSTSDAQLEQVLQALVERGWLAAEGVVVIERSVRSDPPPTVEGITPVQSRRYGETVLWYFRTAVPAMEEGLQ
jgi:16S rRNA (guanine(966)-N(2))-methyltransferase RsmD